VAPSQRLRRGQVEDGRVDAMGYVGSCYPCFAIFFMLGSRDTVVILVFYLSLLIGSTSYNFSKFHSHFLE
jgi:hypothetical protein